MQLSSCSAIVLLRVTVARVALGEPFDAPAPLREPLEGFGELGVRVFGQAKTKESLAILAHDHVEGKIALALEKKLLRERFRRSRHYFNFQL